MKRDGNASANSATPGWRKMTGLAVRRLGYLLGLAMTLVYEALVWTSADPDWSHMRPRGFIGLYITVPMLILAGTICLFSWISARIDPDRPAA
jgi:hypothetical protein